MRQTQPVNTVRLYVNYQPELKFGALKSVSGPMTEKNIGRKRAKREPSGYKNAI